MQVIVEFSIINYFDLILRLIRLEVLLSCFCILTELLVDTKSVSSSSDGKFFFFFDKLTSSRCTFVWKCC